MLQGTCRKELLQLKAKVNSEIQVWLFIMDLHLKGLQPAMYRSTAITPNSANSVVPRARYTKNWATHAARDIVCIPGRGGKARVKREII